MVVEVCAEEVEAGAVAACGFEELAWRKSASAREPLRVTAKRNNPRRNREAMERAPAKKYMGRVYRRTGRAGHERRGDLQIGGRDGEGNCAGGRGRVFCRMRAQERQEADKC